MSSNNSFFNTEFQKLMQATQPTNSNARIQEVLANRQVSPVVPQQTPNQYDDGNFTVGDFVSNTAKNIFPNIGSIATGLLGAATNPVETAESLIDLGTEMVANPTTAIPTTWNIMADRYNLGTDDLTALINGEKTLGQFGTDVARGVSQYPVDALIDVIPFTKGLSLNKAMKAAGTATDIINVNKAKIAQKAKPIFDIAEDIKKVNPSELAEAIRYRETGEVFAKGYNSSLSKKLRDYSKDYDKLVKEFSPETWTPSNKLSVAQRISRLDNMPYQTAEKMITPYYDNPNIFKQVDASKFNATSKADIIKGKKRVLTKQGKEALTKMANSGDDVAKRILEGEDLHRKGWISPVPHGLAEVAKDTGVNTAERIMAKRFSSRVYGTAGYEDIAKQILKPDKWLSDQMLSFTERTVTDELLGGTLMGNPLTTGKLKDVRYINRAELANKGARNIKSIAKETQTAADDIAIDKQYIDAIDKQISLLVTKQPYKGEFLADLYTVGKSVPLASGRYLVGNLQTGLANTLLNAGLNPVGLAQDVMATAVTRGNLAKNLGVYRPLGRNDRVVNTPVLKQVNALNAPLSDLWNAADARIQNWIAETAANTNLRRKGVPLAKRESAVLSMQDAKLAEIIKDVQKISLMNTTNTILPKSLHSAASLANPFWQWVDTAAQSSYYMFQKAPVTANVFMVDTLSRIGLDQEMQNRYNLKVESDKPFVSYRYNPRTRKIEEVSAEFIPFMNTLKTAGTLSGVLSGGLKGEDITDVIGNGSPIIAAFGSAMAGKTKYGRPILRSHEGLHDMVEIQGNKRYRKVNGRWEEDNRFHIDEPVVAAIRESVGWIPLANNTFLPAFAALGGAITGTDLNYYKPYDNALFGDFNINPYDNKGNALFYGNPMRRIGGAEFADIITGKYATPYYEERPLSVQQMMRLNRGGARDFMRGINNVLNLGGQ